MFCSRIKLRSTLAVVALTLSIASNRSSAQQPQLSPQAQKVRAKVKTIPPGTKISVIRKQGPETYGTLISADETAFTYHDVDDNSDKTVPYEEIKKVKVGYGGYNSIHHKHTDRTKGLIITVIVVGGLIGLMFAATASL